MFIKSFGLAAASTLFLLQTLTAEHLVIENFDGYANTEELRQSWNSFGSAASSGPATLEIEKGYTGSNAALFNLNWDAGDNANMRMFRPPADAQDLTEFVNFIVWLKIKKEDGDFDEPSAATTLRIAIEGGSDDTIWQTKSEFEVEVIFEDYQEAQFSLLDSEMERVAGKSSFNDTLADIKSIRLRFENEVEPYARQDVFVDSIVTTTDSQ